MTQPTLQNNRLILRPFSQLDAPAVFDTCRLKEVAKMLCRVPHPYIPEYATSWIAAHGERFDKNIEHTFAIAFLERPETAIGSISLIIDQTNDLAELGYWLSPVHWGKGIMTEATGQIVSYAFSTLNLNRLQARHLATNSGSRRVLEKNGFRYEGTFRQGTKRFGELIDLEWRALLRSDVK